MKRFSNRYIMVFSAVMVVTVAVILSLAATLLQPRQTRNLELEKKKSILESINITASFRNADELFANHIIESFVVDHKGEKKESIGAFMILLKNELRKPAVQQNLPVFVATGVKGERLIILPLEGKGLWGPVYGYISFLPDLNTVYGVTFDHKSETPGLGAEINTREFEGQFAGKKIFKDGKLVSVKVLKSNEKQVENHSVDAISGGTITSKGLEAMLFDCIAKYEDFLRKNAE